MIKQLNLPFAQPNYEYEPLPDDTKHRIKRLEVDYNKLNDGRVKKLTTEYTYLRDGRILTAHSTEIID